MHTMVFLEKNQRAPEMPCLELSSVSESNLRDINIFDGEIMVLEIFPGSEIRSCVCTLPIMVLFIKVGICLTFQSCS